MKIRSHTAITASSFTAMFFLGVMITVVGASARNIGLRAHEIGWLAVVQNAGFLISVFFSGSLSDIYSKPAILLTGCLVLSAGLFLFYGSAVYPMYLIAMFFIGAGIGSFEGVTDVMLLEMHPGRVNLFISINHFFVTLGSLAIATYLIFLQMLWRRSLVQAAGLVLLLAVFFLLVKLPPTDGPGKRLFDRIRSLKDKRTFILLYLATICILGIGTGMVNFLTTFLMQLRGFDQITSKLGLVLYLSGVGTGRLIVGFLTKKERLHQVLLGLFGISTVSTSVLFFVRAGVLTYPLIFLTGVTISGLLPSTFALAGHIYRDAAGTALGIIKTGIPVGGIVFPFVYSLFSRFASFEFSLVLFPAFAFAGFVIMLSFRGRIDALMHRAHPFSGAGSG